MERKGFFQRLTDLWCGFWGVKVRKAEARHVEVVYHNAIQKRMTQYEELRAAVAKLVCERNRVDSRLATGKEDLALLEHEIVRAAANDHDAQALALMEKRRLVEAERQRLETELTRLTDYTTAAKQSLREVKQSIARLKAEQSEVLARKAMATARLQIKETLQKGLATPTTDSGLEHAREAVAQLEQDAELADPIDAAAPGDVTLADLRREAQKREDREALEQLKRKLGANLLVDGRVMHAPVIEAQRVAEVV